jgi:hypothetical protein
MKLVADVCTATFGQCCCYCKSGSPVSVYTAVHPLGPWAKQNQIGFSSHCPQHLPTSRASAILPGSSLQSHTHCNSSNSITTAVGAQQSDVFPWMDSEGVLQFM